jgi:hypothetical protein
LFMYADDTALIVSHKNIDIAEKFMQNEYNNILKWSHDRNLIINKNKTAIIHFRTPHTTVSHSPRIKSHICTCLLADVTHNCNCELLRVVNEIRYLGVILDYKLKWNAHIDYISKKLSGVSAKIYYLNKNIPPDSLYLIYKSLFESILRYGVDSWGSAANYLLQRIERLQLRTLKCIVLRLPSQFLSAPFDNDNSSIYIFFNTLTPKNFYIYKLILNFKNNYLHRQLSPNPRYQLRCPMRYQIPKFNNLYGKRSLPYIVPKIFNDLPTIIIDYSKTDCYFYVVGHKIDI